MKKNLLRIVIALGGTVAASGLAATIAVGCGGDDTGGEVAADGGGDEKREDAKIDTSLPDAGDAGDAAQPDASDAGDADAAPTSCDGAPAIGDFTHAADDAFCGRMRECCLVTNESAWDQTSCTGLFDFLGGFQYWGQYDKSLDAGDIQYDTCKAVDCIRDLSRLFCGKLTAADVLAVRKECNQVVTGQVDQAGDCVSTIQCKQGLFCQTAEDGGGGKCIPLLNEGQSCVQYTSPVVDQACTYRGLGLETSTLYCNTAPDAGVCAKSLGNDAGCATDPQCSSAVCAYGTCVTESVLADPGQPGGFCDVFSIKDAGGGG